MDSIQLQRLLSNALGYEVDLKPRLLSKHERIENKIARLNERAVERISKGRTRGAGACGFNRDIENISHQIRLLNIELSDVDE